MATMLYIYTVNDFSMVMQYQLIENHSHNDYKLACNGFRLNVHVKGS